jgi:hypothetical protein
MLQEFMIPLVTLCCVVLLGIASLDKLVFFHQVYQEMASKLESERWLLEQCSDPHFFSKMHTHTNLCFQVENNARVGAFMLSLREVMRSFMIEEFLYRLVVAMPNSLLSWPALAAVMALLLFAPSWLARGTRSLRGSRVNTRRWAQCCDGHFKDS